MTEEEKVVVTDQQDPNDQLLETIADLKNRMDGMIPSEKYNELEKQNKKLLSDYVNTRPAPKEVEHVYKKEDLDAAARELVELGKKGVTNREYVEASLRHRDISLEITGKDPYGQNGEKSPESVRSAEFFAHALDNSTSASGFRMMLDQGIHDDPQVLSKVNQYRAQVRTDNKKNRNRK